MIENEYSGPIYFVGGAPRSGTTVTHALLCTSQKVNAYHSEISYVTPMVQSYVAGLNNWDAHTYNFFAEKEHFHWHMQNLIGQTFSHIHRALGAPEIMSVKDPMLTPYFAKLQSLLGNRARFVTVIRNPYDVVRSRQEVARKAGQDFTVQSAKDVCRQYMLFYRHIDAPTLQNQLVYFRYEDLLEKDVLEKLHSFTGCDDISTDNVWGKKQPQAASGSSDNPWHSPKYHSSIDLTNRLSPLDEVYRNVVNETCTPMMTRFGYPAT